MQWRQNNLPVANLEMWSHIAVGEAELLSCDERDDYSPPGIAKPIALDNDNEWHHTTMAKAQSLFTPRMSDRIFTMARLTQPRMMQLMGIPK